jgi:hypothetical protein
MSDLGGIAGRALVFLMLAGFFVWVMLQMASFSHSNGRLAALAIGLAIGTIGVGIVYALTGPMLGRRDD